MTSSSNMDSISTVTMLKYGIGGLGLTLFSGMFAYVYNFYFYNFSSPSINIGLILGYTFLIFGIWNAINDPIFGFISDKTRSRWGRRRPYIIFFIPVLIVGILMLFFPMGTGFTFYFIWILLALFIYDTGYTFVGLTYASLLPELTFDLDKRAKTNTFSIIFMGVGTVVSTLAGFLFLQKVSDFQLMAIIFALIGGGALLVTGLTLREKRKYIEVPALGAIDAVLKSFKNKSFLTFEGFNFTYTLVYSIIQITMIQFVISVLELSDIEGFIVIGIFFLCALASLPIMIYLNRKLGTKRTVFIFMALFAVALSLTIFIQTFLMTILLVILLGFCFGAPNLLNSLLIADIIDEDAIKTKRRREGMYFGANALVTKPALSVATFIVGLFNTYFFFNPSFDIHSPKYVHADTALLSIRLTFGIIPALFLVLGLLCLIFYPLNKNRVEEIKKQLNNMDKE
ncbi:MAG: MFS transporter [Candidatus Helarchaeota archaeon]